VQSSSRAFGEIEFMRVELGQSSQSVCSADTWG
jgi:hypothetical protein